MPKGDETMEKKKEQLFSELTKAIAAPYEKKLAEANAKLEAIKKALPDPRIGKWQPATRAFIEKVRKEVEHGGEKI